MSLNASLGQQLHDSMPESRSSQKADVRAGTNGDQVNERFSRRLREFHQMRKLSQETLAARRDAIANDDRQNRGRTKGGPAQ